MPASPLESWTVLGDDAAPIEPIERYLAYLTDIERSPNTIKAYAHDLKDWFSFLGIRGLDWREVRLEDVGEFVAWLRLPPAARNGAVTVLPSVEHHCGVTTVNRKLGGQRLLPARRPSRRRPGRAADDLATGRAPQHRVEAVPAPRHQGQAASSASDLAEDPQEAAADPHRLRGPGHPGRLRAVAVPSAVRRAVRLRYLLQGSSSAIAVCSSRSRSSKADGRTLSTATGVVQRDAPRFTCCAERC
ncbi:site-specific integrase [Streptomyces sp. WAC05858]|uniref:site-specific integrase n=1 Tax=Streptomyces TaxID=1883 RepID=UPI001C8DC5E4